MIHTAVENMFMCNMSIVLLCFVALWSLGSSGDLCKKFPNNLIEVCELGVTDRNFDESLEIRSAKCVKRTRDNRPINALECELEREGYNYAYFDDKGNHDMVYMSCDNETCFTLDTLIDDLRDLNEEFGYKN